MVNFGFSAFVRLLSLNDRPQATVMRQRLGPASDGGYDFHKQMRRFARRYLVGGEPLQDLLAAAEAIKNPAEACSAVAALGKLETWHEETGGRIVEFGPATYVSPGKLFTVKFDPTVALHISGRTAPIEIWNTMQPPLSQGPTYAALSIAAEAYASQGIELENIGLLSLQNPVRLYLLTDVPRQTVIAATLVSRFEEMIRSPQPPRPRPEDRPSV
jgi:hypothetical protein